MSEEDQIQKIKTQILNVDELFECVDLPEARKSIAEAVANLIDAEVEVTISLNKY